MIAAHRRHRTYPVILPEESVVVAPHRRPRRAHPLARGLVLLTLFGAPLLGHVWLESQAAQAGYRLRALRQEVAQLEREREALRSQAAALRSPDRLERLAARWGLKPPSPDQLAAVVVPGDLVSRPAVASAPPPWWERLARFLHDTAAVAAERPRP
ncbi:MAG: hypothetical protein RMM30_10085 [Armatimonadota bacterium]|nr:hypothetical protein [Armatimonadota bacterium]MDW8156914.1 hypothetical protein [Armatimonadota bacterium]